MPSKMKKISRRPMSMTYKAKRKSNRDGTFSWYCHKCKGTDWTRLKDGRRCLKCGHKNTG